MAQKFLTNIRLIDDAQAQFGHGGDLKIWHDSGTATSYISDQGSGDLYIQADSMIRLESRTDTEKMATFHYNGAVKLYYDNSLKFQTTSAGAQVGVISSGTLNENTGVKLAIIGDGGNNNDGLIITRDNGNQNQLDQFTNIYNDGTATFVASGGTSTHGTFDFKSTNDKGDTSVSRLAISAAGDATFKGDVSIVKDVPSFDFVDSSDDSDFRLRNNNGVFEIYDTTNSAARLSIASDGGITGNFSSVTAEWDGTRTGDATITGNLTLIEASDHALIVNRAANSNAAGILIHNDNNMYCGAVEFKTEYSGTDTNLARVLAGTDGSNGHLYLQVADSSDSFTYDSVLVLSYDNSAAFKGHVSLPATKKLFLDGNSNPHTFLQEISDDRLGIYAGNRLMLDLGENGDASSYIDMHAPTVSVHSNQADNPYFQLRNTTNDANSGHLRFTKDRGAAGQDDDLLGTIDWLGKNDAGSPENTEYARIQAQISDASDGNEGGKLRLGVASHDGSIAYGLVLTDGNAAGEVDATIGASATSLTTVAGDLSVYNKITFRHNNNHYIQSGTNNWAFKDGSSNSSALLLTTAGRATFTEDVIAAGVYVGSRNDSFDLYNNGTTYLNGTTTLDDHVTISSLANYKGIDLIGTGASRPQVKFSNATQGILGQIFGTELNQLVVASGTGGNIALTVRSHQDVSFESHIASKDHSTEMVSNGAFAGISDGTDVAGLSGWNAYGSVTSRDIESEELKLVTTAANTGALYQFTTVIGQVYHVTATTTGDTGAGGIHVDNTAEGAVNFTTVDGVDFYFTASATTTTIYFRAGNNTAGTIYYDNVSIKEVVNYHLGDGRLNMTRESGGDAGIKLVTTSGGDPNITFNSKAANRSGLIKFQDQGTNIGRIEYVHNGDVLRFQAGSATGQILELSNTQATFAGDIHVGAKYVGRDAHNRVDFATDDVIHYRVGDSFIYRMDGSGFRPYTDSTHDLGGSSYYWKDAYIDTITTTGSVTVGGKVTHPHKKYCSASISNSYVRIYFADDSTNSAGGSELATIVRLTGTSHGTSHVGSFTALINVSHYQDVHIESFNNFYGGDTGGATNPVLKVESDNNGSYTLSMKTASTNAATYYFTIECLTSESTITTLPGSTASTNTTHEHTMIQGSHSTGTGGYKGVKIAGDLHVKQLDDGGFDEGFIIERSSTTQKLIMGMDGGAVNFNSPESLSYKFRANGSTKLELDGSGNADFTGSITAGGDITATGADMSIAHASGPEFSLRRDDTTTAADDRLGQIQFGSDDPTNGTFNYGAAIKGMAGVAWDTNSYPGYLVFQTRNTSGALATALTLDYQKKGIFAGDLTVQGTTTHLENNVLIGNSNADYLEVRYNNSADYATRLKFSGVQFGNNGANKIIAGRTATGGYFDFYTNNTNDGLGGTPDGTVSLTLQADGDAILHQNVGIGTSGPGAKLNVFTGGNSIAAAAVLQHDTFGADRKVGLGFELGDTQIKAAVGFISDDSSVGTHGRGNLIFCVDSNDDAAPVGHADEKMRITHAGNVGINVAAPASKLHIRTSTNFNYEFEEVSSALRISALNDARDANVPLEFAASNFGFLTGNTTFKSSGNAYIMYLNTDDNAISDTAKIIFNDRGAVGWNGSSVYLSDDGSNKDLELKTGTGHIYFKTGNTERVRIDDGNAELRIGGSTSAGFVDFDGTSLQLNTQRNPNTGTFVNTSKSHASIIMTGADADSSIKFYTAAANNTTATLRWTIDKTGALIKNGGTSSQYLMADGSVSTSVTDNTKLPLAGGTMTGDLIVNSEHLILKSSSPELYFWTTNNHVNWLVAAQESTNACLEFSAIAASTSLDQDASNYTPVLKLFQSGAATFAGTISTGGVTASNYHSSADNFVISGDGHPGMTIDGGSDKNCSIFFADGVSGDQAYRGIIQYQHDGDSLVLYTAASLALTINSSQNTTFAGSVDVGTFTLAGSGIIADAGMTLQIGGGSVNALTLANSSGDATFAANVSTASGKRISIGTWDNSAFTGGAAQGFYAEGTTPMLLLEEDGESKTGYVGMSSGNMYVGGVVSNFYVQTNNGTTALTIDSSYNATFEKGLVVNEGSHDADFRVESNGEAYMLRVDGGNNRFGVATQNPSTTFHVTGTSTFTGTITAQGISSTSGTVSFADGGSNFDSSDAQGYARFTHAGGSAQIGLFRSGTAVGGVHIGGDSGGFNIYASTDAAGTFGSQILDLDMSGNLQIDGDLKLDATKKLYLDGGSNTYIHESAGDDIDIVAGGNTSIAIRGINTIFGGYVHLNGIVNATGVGAEIGRNHAYDTLELKGYGAELMIGGQHTTLHINYRTCNNGTSNHTPTDWYWRAGASNNWSNHNFGNVVVNGSLTCQPDADSNLWIGNVGTDATGIYGGSGDVLYIGGNNQYQLYMGPNNYVYLRTWMNFAAGEYGVYSSTNSAHFFPNNSLTYGVWKINGARNNYTGIAFGNGGNAVTGMFDSGGNGGDYNSTSGWHFYYHRSNDCLAVADSTTSSSYGLYVTGAIYSTADVVAYSDRRAKENIVTVDNALDKVSELRGVYYNKKDSDDDKRQVGVIAQEVKEVLPEVVTYDKENDKYGVDYGKINGLLIEAIKDLKKEIEELKQCKKCTDCDCNN